MAGSPHIYTVKGVMISLCIRYDLINKSLQKRAWPTTPAPATASMEPTLSTSAPIDPTTSSTEGTLQS